MNLGIFLPIGSSFKDLKKTGQDKRFKNYYLKPYAKAFDNVFVFSYEKEKAKLPKGCFIIENKFKIQRFFYAFAIPFINKDEIKEIDVFRVMQLTGSTPAILTKIFFKKPFIVTYGYDYISFAKLEKQKIRPILLRLMEKIAFKHALGIIVTTNQIKKTLQKKYPKTKIFYVPNGVDITKFKVPSRKAGRQSSKFKVAVKNLKFNVLFVGRLEKQKNLLALLKAVSLLKKHNLKLLFIGQGSLKGSLIKLAKDLKVDLKIIDKVDYQRIFKYYKQADIFCLPSFKEGQPKALLEAMACGLPCLVAKYEGVEEFEDKKEILVTGFKADEIKKNLEILIKDQTLRKKLGINARNRIVKDFNIKKLLKKEIRALKNV